MNGFENLSKPLAWIVASLLAASLAGCGGGAGGSATDSQAAKSTVVADSSGNRTTSTGSPTVVSESPGNGATNVPTSTNSSSNVVTGTEVVATFSQPMDPATIDSSPAGTLRTFTLKEKTGNVPGTVAMNAANTVATFTPSASSLTPNTLYTATITTAAKSTGGVAMAKHVAWSFTTKPIASTGQAPVSLGTAGKFVILSKSGISTVPTSHLTGDIGVSPISHTAITGFSETMDSSNTFSTSTQVTGKIYAADYTAPTPTYMTTAVSDMAIAYTDAAGRTLPNFTELGAGQIGGLTLVPGLYKWGTDVSISTDVTLAGGPNDVWIFQIAGNITQAAATHVTLTGGALAKNVFWQSAGATAIGATAHFEGIILSKTLIAMKTGASANGRMLAQTAVTLDQATLAQPAQ